MTLLESAASSRPNIERSTSLAIVIVSYRCRELLRRCLLSLDRHPSTSPTQVYVVDNASGDGTPRMVREQFPNVRLTEATRNLGYAAANNLVIRLVSDPYVLLLNPDTEVREGVLDRLLSCMEARPGVGMIGPRLETPDGTFDHAARRHFPTPVSALGHFTGIGRRLSGGPLASYRAPEVAAGPVDAVNGAFMLVRRSALDEVGLLDEGYWMYMEDLDICWRLAQAGWTTWYEPSAVVGHVRHGSSGVNRTWRLNYHFHYGMYRFYRKHYAPDHHPLFNGFVYAGIAVKLVATAIASAARRSISRPSAPEERHDRARR